MGLIRAAASAVSGVLRDQWKELFYCDSMDAETLVVKGVKRTPTGNNRGSDDVISNGSAIDVADGQVAIIIEDGKIIEFSAEPGRFVWNTSSEASCFTGPFFQSLLESFKNIGGRITYGGDPGKVQRVYYVNTKEIMDNKFGTSTPMTYDDPYYKTVLYIRYFGQFSFKIADPLLFYTAISGNVADRYTKANLESLITDEFMTALDVSLAKCAASGVKFSMLAAKQKELSEFMQEELSHDWKEKRGLEVCSVAIAKVTPDDKSRERIETFDMNVMHSGKDAMVGGLAYAQMEAMKNAAANENGALGGFMAMGLAQNAMGNMSQANQALINNANTGSAQPQAPDMGVVVTPAPKADSWICPECNTENTGKFCTECGHKKPEAETWECPECKTVNNGKFCTECGHKKPE